MATALSSVILPTSRWVISNRTDVPKAPKRSLVFWKTKIGYEAGRLTMVRPVMSAPTPPGISEKVEESIEKAKEACEGDAASGECAAAWDEVEELSAAGSHARDKAKDSDPLETYCKDNPETNECRTYED